jgi:mono/diheme cytochrome c family protein
MVLKPREGLPWVFCALVFLIACGCNLTLPGKPNPKDRPRTPSQITSFAPLYAKHCAGCHGADGKLGPAPPLADPLFLAIVPDDELVRVIRDGRPGTPMPAFSRRHEGPLTDEQLKIVADGLRQRWKSEEPPDAKLPEYAAAENARADAARGAEVFARACADCHGADGEGSGPDEKPGRINDPALLALVSDQALRRIVITGRPDLGMPDYAGDEGRSGDFHPLSSDEIGDLVALLASWRNPQGSESK